MSWRQLEGVRLVRLRSTQARLVLIVLAHRASAYECEVEVDIAWLKQMTELPATTIRQYIRLLASCGLVQIERLTPTIICRLTLPGVPRVDQSSGEEIPWS